MNCFNDSTTPAVGSCKSCHKGLCQDCATDTGKGLACRDTCETDVLEIWEMNERGKKIYGIGKYKTRMPSSGVLLWGGLSLVLWVLVGFSYIKNSEVDGALVVPAVLMTVIAGFAYYSARRTGLNC